jgi:hypothetical protein
MKAEWSIDGIRICRSGCDWQLVSQEARIFNNCFHFVDPFYCETHSQVDSVEPDQVRVIGLEWLLLASKQEPCHADLRLSL